MLIKSADDKAGDIAVLEAMLKDESLKPETKIKIEQEMLRMLSGIKGEREAAFEIDAHYENSENWAVIHDLRIQQNKDAAQIDHILVNRFLDIWVCESKRFSGGIEINEHGEYLAFSGDKSYGIPSPIEQNRRHCSVLQAVLKEGKVEIPKRLTLPIKPRIRGLVLVSKNAIIKRPKGKIDGVKDIIKVDQVRTHIDKIYDKGITLNPAKLIGQDTLEKFSCALAALHAPASTQWRAKFGVEPMTAKRICITCGTAVGDDVANYCWSHAKFQGRLYCRPCQKNVTTSA